VCVGIESKLRVEFALVPPGLIEKYMAPNNPLDGNFPLPSEQRMNDQLQKFRSATAPLSSAPFDAMSFYATYSVPGFEQVVFTPHWRPDAHSADALSPYVVGPDFGDDVGPPGSARTGAPPKLSVELNDSPSAHPLNPKDRQLPTVVIQKNGDVTDLKGKVLTPDEQKKLPAGQDLVIHVDASKAEKPNYQQKVALARLTDTWASLIQKTYADKLPQVQNVDGSTVSQVQIDDESHVVPPDIHEKFGNDSPPVQAPMNLDLPTGSQQIQDMSGSMDRMRDSGTGLRTFTQPEIQNQIPQRDADVMDRNVVPALQAVLDTTAGLNKLDSESGSNYDAVHKQPTGIYRVGRYGIRQELVQSMVLDTIQKYMTSDELKLLGNPPPKDWASLMQVLKNHPELKQALDLAMKNAILEIARKLAEEAKKTNDEHTAKFAKSLEAFANKFDDPKFAEGFTDFVTKLDGKHGDISKADLAKYMPKEFQEFVVQNRQQAFATAIASDHNPEHMTAQEAAQVVLAIYMGHVPSAHDMSDPGAKKFMDEAANFYTLDRMGRLSTNGNVTVGGVTYENGNHGLMAVAQEMVGKKVWAMTPWAGKVENGNEGCAASISYLLKHAGEKIAGSAGVEDLVSQLVHNGWHLHLATTREELNDPNKVVVYRGAKREHVGLTTGNGGEVDNSSTTGKLTARTIASSDSFDPNKFPGRVYYLDKNA